MRRSNRTDRFLSMMCLAICLAASSATRADDADSKQPADTNGVDSDSQAESTAASAKESEHDPVELAKSLTNADFSWDFNFFGIMPHFSDRAKRFEAGEVGNSRQSWEIRYDWMAGLEDPKRDEVCHMLLSIVYDSERTIGEKYFNLFKWSDNRFTWNGRIFHRRENMLPTIEAERQMLVAAWRRRISDWEDEQFLKDRDGPAIQEAIKIFVKKIHSNPVDERVLKQASLIEAIADRRKDLKVKPFNALMPGIDPARNPDGFRILKAAYLAGNLKEQLRKGHGEDCPFAGVRTMVVVYDDLKIIHLVEESEVLDQWLFWIKTEDNSRLERAVDTTLLSASYPPPPPQPISQDE